jgi:hypothetical protein
LCDKYSCVYGRIFYHTFRKCEISLIILCSNIFIFEYGFVFVKIDL